MKLNRPRLRQYKSSRKCFKQRPACWNENKSGVIVVVVMVGGGGGGGREHVVRTSTHPSPPPHTCSTQLQAYKAGAEAQRRAQLKHIAVVGITCAGAAGAAGSALEGQRFDVVVLDECSQMIEPLALLPMVLGKPRYVCLQVLS